MFAVRRPGPAPLGYRFEGMVDHSSAVRNGWLVLWDDLEVLFANGVPIAVSADPGLSDDELLAMLVEEGIHALCVRWEVDAGERVGRLQLAVH